MGHFFFWRTVHTWLLLTLTILHSTEYWLHYWISFMASLFLRPRTSVLVTDNLWKERGLETILEGTPGQRACSFAHTQSGRTVSNLLLWKFGDRSYIICLLIASQDILRLLQIIIALSAFSIKNRSLLKCEATLSGRDTQSEMETETSCEAQALTLECSQHTPRLYC